jgi:hypothetical protein
MTRTIAFFMCDVSQLLGGLAYGRIVAATRQLGGNVS